MHQPGYESSSELLHVLVFICLLFALSSALFGFYTWAGAAGLVLAVLIPYTVGYARADGFALTCLEKLRTCGRAVRDFNGQHGRYPDESEFDTLAQDYKIPESSESRCVTLCYTKPADDAPADFIIIRCDIRSLSLKTIIELQKNGTLRRR